MSKALVSLLCLSFLAPPAWSQAEPESPAAPQVQADAADAPPEQIMVAGQRPGPGLWKVSKGEHVLWIFGTYAPLPKKMEWRSHEVESIVAQSQEYLTSPGAKTEIGFFKKISLLPHVIGVQKNPDGAHLKDVLPADVYARWLLLKAKYIGEDDGIERHRPFFAAERLHRAGLSHAGLASDNDVQEAIFKIIKKNKLKVTHSEVAVPLQDPARMLKAFKKSSMDDAACFGKTLDRLETDLDTLRVRANAWAMGDLEEIQKVGFADRDDACRAAMTSSSVVKDEPAFDGLERRVLEKWLTSVDTALATNRSTFAMMPLRALLDPKGLVAALEARGYVVEKPE